jgi:ketosteroid isomerase-like protein
VAESAETVARRYFEAVTRHDLEGALACWAPGGVDNLAPVGELRVPDEWRAYFEQLFAAIPDFTHEQLDVIADGDLVAVRWRAGGMFTGGPLLGVRATGARVTIEGADIVRVEDGLIQRLDSYWDDMTTARHLGLLPARGSRQERALTALFNARIRLKRALGRSSSSA